MKKNCKITFITTLLLGSFIIQGNAQFGKVGGLLKKSKKVTSIAESPAKASMQNFDNYAEKLQYCIDNQVWADKNNNQYSDILGYAKTHLKKIEEKDARLAPKYQEKFALYQKHWDDHKAEQASAAQAQEDEDAKAKEQAHQPIEDDGMTSDFHKQHVGQIVFSNEKLDLEQPNKAAVKTTFKLGEPIFMRLYLKQSMGNFYRNYRKENRDNKGQEYWEYYYLKKEKGNYVCKSPEAVIIQKLFLNGKEIRSDRKEYTKKSIEQIDKWTSWWKEVIPKENVRYAELEELAYALGKDLAFAKPGEHTIKVETWLCHYKDYTPIEIIAQGECKINFTEAEHKAYRKTRGQLMPLAGMTDAKLAESFKSMLAKKEPTWDIKNIVITSERWTVYKNDFDIPTQKRLFASIAVSYDGECRIIEAAFRQDYEGGGKYGSTFLTSYDDYDRAKLIHCDDIFVKP